MMDAIDRNLDRIWSALRTQGLDQFSSDHRPLIPNELDMTAPLGATAVVAVQLEREYTSAGDDAPAADEAPVLTSLYPQQDIAVPKSRRGISQSDADNQQAWHESVLSEAEVIANAPEAETSVMQFPDPTPGIEVERGSGVSASSPISFSETRMAIRNDNFWDRLKRSLGWRA